MRKDKTVRLVRTFNYGMAAWARTIRLLKMFFEGGLGWFFSEVTWANICFGSKDDEWKVVGYSQ